MPFAERIIHYCSESACCTNERTSWASAKHVERVSFRGNTCYDATHKNSISHKTVYVRICSCSTPHICTHRMSVAIAVSVLPHLSCNTLAVKTLQKAQYKSSKIKAAIAKPTVPDSTKRKRHTQHKQSRQHKQFAFQSVAAELSTWTSFGIPSVC